MQARITRFKMRPEEVEAARQLVLHLRDEIMAQPGIERCITVMNGDGSGYVLALVDGVRAIWHKVHDHLETVPEPEIFEVLVDWPG